MIAVGTFFQLIGGHVRRRVFAYLMVCAVLAMGIAAGSGAVGTVDVTSRAQMSQVLETFFAEPSADTIPPPRERVIQEAFSGDILRTAALLWVLGLSVIGSPLILVITFFRGFALGFTFAFMIEEMDFRGLVLAIASLVPHNTLSLLGLIVAASSGLTFAGVAARILLGRRTEYTVYRQFASSAALTAVSAALILGGMFIEAYVTPVLIGVVERYIL